MAHFGFHTTGNEVVDAFADRVKGKIFLITGPSPGGIGAETAYSLAKGEPALLILAGRSKPKIQPVIDEIDRRFAHVKTVFVHLELDNQLFVRQAVEDVKSLGVKIDGLINNAAVMACPYAKTADGIELQFGTNHIGHFLFTNLLLQAGIIPHGGHIVNVSSVSSESFDVRSQFDDITYQNGSSYQPWRAYSVAKLANVLYSRSLAAKLRAADITVLSLNPGSIASNLQRHVDMDNIQPHLQEVAEANPGWARPERKSLQEGCSTTLRAALDPSLAGNSGAYLDDCQIKEPARHISAYAEEDKVWALSEQLVGERFVF